MAKSKHALFVDDDARTRTAYERLLKANDTTASWSCTTVERPACAVHLAHTAHIDVVVTDMFFGGLEMTGLHLVRALRAIPSAVPILAVSAKDWSDKERAEILRAGADGVMSLPLAYSAELIAWLEMLSRRVSGAFEAAPFRIGDVELDYANRLVRIRGQQLMLTRNEYTLLCVLAACTPRPVPYTDLARAIGQGSNHERHSLTEAIRRLRAKLAGAGVSVEAVSGLGYCLVVSQRRAG